MNDAHTEEQRAARDLRIGDEVKWVGAWIKVAHIQGRGRIRIVHLDNNGLVPSQASVPLAADEKITVRCPQLTLTTRDTRPYQWEGPVV